MLDITFTQQFCVSECNWCSSLFKSNLWTKLLRFHLLKEKKKEEEKTQHHQTNTEQRIFVYTIEKSNGSQTQPN